MTTFPAFAKQSCIDDPSDLYSEWTSFLDEHKTFSTNDSAKAHAEADDLEDIADDLDLLYEKTNQMRTEARNAYRVAKERAAEIDNPVACTNA